MFLYRLRLPRRRAITTTDITWERFERVLSVVSHPYRYRLVSVLLDEPAGRITLDALVDDLVEWESRFEDRTADPYRVRLQLVHHHLPKLERAGFLEYDPDSETISVVPNRGR
jgi:hypothetical protein